MPTTTPLGKVSITPRGEFTLGAQYRILDVVYIPTEHAAFLARKDNINVGLEDGDTWMKLAQGTDGESAFDAAVAGGYAGTKEEFYQELADFNGYATKAKESADSATASKEEAQQAAEIATAKAEEMQNTLGTQPEGAGTVWENIGERPQGVTGTLWENRGSGTPGVDVKPVVTKLTFEDANPNSNTTIENQNCYSIQTGNIITLYGSLRVTTVSTTSFTLVCNNLSPPSRNTAGSIRQRASFVNNTEIGVLTDGRCLINFFVNSAGSLTFEIGLTYQLDSDFGASVIKPDLTPITNRLTTVESRAATNETNITTINGEIGSGFSTSNTIASNIGTRPSGKTGTLWSEIEKGEHSITSPANVTLTGTGGTKVNSNNSYYIKSGNLVFLVVNCSLESTDRDIDVGITGIPACAGKHVNYDLNIPIAAIDFSLSRWFNYPLLRLNPRNPPNPAGISAHYATEPTGTIYLTLAGYAVYIAAQ